MINLLFVLFISLTIDFALARFPLEEQHVVAEITADTPLVHLLPTTTVAGACTTVLIDYLLENP